jgi:hypothetical protein
MVLLPVEHGNVCFGCNGLLLHGSVWSSREIIILIINIVVVVILIDS